MKNENMKDNPSSVKKVKKPLTKKAKIAIIVVTSLVLAAALAVGIVFFVAAMYGNSVDPSSRNDKYFNFNSDRPMRYNRSVDEVVKIFQEDCGIQLLDPREHSFSFGELVLDGSTYIDEYEVADKVVNPIGFGYTLKTENKSAEEAVVSAIKSATGIADDIYVSGSVGFSISKSPQGIETTIYEDAKVKVLQGFLIADTKATASYRVVDKEKNISFIVKKVMTFHAFAKNPEMKDLVAREMFKPVFDVLEEIMAFYVKDAYDINIYT